MGSNQYRTRWGPDLPAPQRGDPGREGVPLQMRCGEVWGTRCRAWVRPPSFSHGGHPDGEMRRAAAARPSCPPPVLQWLAQDSMPGVRTQVAANPGCPGHLLRQLAQDPNDWVRTQVAAHPGCPPPLLELLARDRSFWVRGAAAANPGCPLEALARLIRDPNPFVRREALGNPERPPHHRMLVRL